MASLGRTLEQTVPGEEGMTTIPKSAGGMGAVQVPVHSQRYKQLLVKKVFAWLVLTESSRSENGADLDCALQLMDAVDYPNLVITIQISMILSKIQPEFSFFTI